MQHENSTTSNSGTIMKQRNVMHIVLHEHGAALNIGTVNSGTLNSATITIAITTSTIATSAIWKCRTLK